MEKERGFMERLQKRIANAGYCSRRKAEELIAAGQVKVNNVVIEEMGYIVNDRDEITVEGYRLGQDKKVYFLLNKPRGIVCTTNDEHDRKDIVSLIKCDYRIYPVGRLDYDTTGLIILTNDGELTNILTHPRNEVPKTYLAKLDKAMAMENFYQIKKGLMIDGIFVKPTRLKLKKNDLEKKTSLVEITICEGRNHIVKRIFKEVGYEVIKLKRETIGFLTIGKLNTGEYRKLLAEEVQQLYKYQKKSRK